MAKLIRNIEDQQNSIGADSKALIEQDLRTKTLNLLTVSGGYISTERDELGNILLHEDPNNLGSNKQLINQYISVDVERRDYDDDELQKVFDTEINELFKSPKTKTAEELREEMERLRKLLAAAEADINITVQEVVGNGEKEEKDEKDEKEEIEKFTSFALHRQAPYIIEATGDGGLHDVTILNDIKINVQTAIWNTDIQRIEHLNLPEGLVNYRILLNNETEELTARLESNVADPERFQGWYFDSENLGNTQNYVSFGNQSNIITINLRGERDENKGSENEFTFAVAYKDEAPPPITTNILTVQMENTTITDYGEFAGIRDDVVGNFIWTLKDDAGNVVNSGNVNNPFTIDVVTGQELTVIMEQPNATAGVRDLNFWYTVADDGTMKVQENTSGVSNNTLTFIIPEDIRGLILRYYSS